MRILARFPDFSAALPQASAEPLQDEPAVVELAVVEPAGSDDSPSPQLSRKPLASQLGSLLLPRRRGLRQIRAGWGSIGFLAMLAAGIWSFAWWQDRQAAEQARDAAAPQVAAAPLEAADQLVR